MIKHQLSKGDILISVPFLEDDYFYRSVVYLCEYNDDSTFGLIVNKQLPHLVEEILPHFFAKKNHLYIGGPVDTDRLFFVHPYGELTGAIPIADNLFWNGDIHELNDMLELGLAFSDRIKFFLGYSGWSPGQLEDEIQDNSWLISSSIEEIVIHSDSDDEIWKKTINRLGEEYQAMAHYPTSLSLN